MGVKRKGLLYWFINNLSYLQKFFLVAMILGVGYFFLGFYLISDMNRKIQNTRIEKEEVIYEEQLIRFLQNAYYHKHLIQKYRRDNISLRDQILHLQIQANELLQKFIKQDHHLQELGGSERQAMFSDGRDRVSPGEVEELWKEIRREVLTKGEDYSNEQHDKLIALIAKILAYGGNIAAIRTDSDMLMYQLIASSSLFLPDVQKSLSRLITIGQSTIRDPELLPQYRDEMIINIALLNYLFEQQEIHLLGAVGQVSLSSSTRDALLDVFNAYREKLTGFVEYMNAGILQINGEVPVKLLDFNMKGMQAIGESFKYWEEITAIMGRILDKRLENLLFRRNVFLIVSISLFLLGLFLGVYSGRTNLRSLNHIVDCAKKISGGDLSARIPILYTEEFGRASIVFNHMAATMEEVMKQFRHLLEATQRLANGDYSARIPIEVDSDDRVKEVCIAFNGMAESFENVVKQLHHLIVDLTTSSKEIAANSKEQEVTVSEQGATTKQISITATEISATAKEFAQMISEVSSVADNTSVLAEEGQASLVDMENIMRHMNDFSANISSSLGVLNEKAGNISVVITTISKVSDQTNLLSLNAAIEAEKAGEFGRSFGVIAREIRRLADLTAMATLDIEKIVSSITEAVSTSVMNIEDFTKAIQDGIGQIQGVSSQLTKIMEHVRTLISRFEVVDKGMQNQSNAAEQINKALQELSKMAYETSVSMTQFHGTIESLDKAATGIRDTLSRVK